MPPFGCMRTEEWQKKHKRPDATALHNRVATPSKGLKNRADLTCRELLSPNPKPSGSTQFCLMGRLDGPQIPWHRQRTSQSGNCLNQILNRSDTKRPLSHPTPAHLFPIYLERAAPYCGKTGRPTGAPSLPSKESKNPPRHRKPQRPPPPPLRRALPNCSGRRSRHDRDRPASGWCPRGAGARCGCGRSPRVGLEVRPWAG